MDFAELVAMLTSPPEDGLPETIYDDLTASYNSVSSIADSGTAKISELEASLVAAQGEISKLKSQNYDLLMAVGEGSGAETEPDDEPSGDDDLTVDDLYTSEDD